MGKRSRARESAGEAGPREIMRAGYARSEQRNEEIRRNLEPLAPGERPGAVTVAAIVALCLGVANTIALALGQTVTDDGVTVYGIATSVVCFVCAAGMWRAKYWAVLGFQALLGITVFIAGALLLVAPGWWQAFVLFTVTALGGWLFWKLVRALARLQMPQH